MDSQPSERFKSGFVAVLGRPNVGKSTLMNAFLGQKIAAISNRPQTTRSRQLGILTLPNAQIIFVDTPGVHQPRHKLGVLMNRVAQESLNDCDIVLFLVDSSHPPAEEDRLLSALIQTAGRGHATILAMNKIDLLEAQSRAEREALFRALLPEAETIQISAVHGDNQAALLKMLIEHLPVGPLYYTEDQITDLYERDIAADLIREACLNFLRDEVPHGVAVRIDEYAEREAAGAYIRATLFVERESHKGIIIGQNGAMLKKIGSAARQEIEAMSERKVFLDLRVKVRKNWRDDENALKGFGYQIIKA